MSMRFHAGSIHESTRETNTVSQTGAVNGRITVKSVGTIVDNSVDTLDFQEAFSLTSSPSGEINASLVGAQTNAPVVTSTLSQLALWNNSSTSLYQKLTNSGTVCYPTSSTFGGIMVNLVSSSNYVAGDLNELRFDALSNFSGITTGGGYNVAGDRLSVYYKLPTVADGSGAYIGSLWEPTSNPGSDKTRIGLIADSICGVNYAGTTAGRGSCIGLVASSEYECTGSTKKIKQIIGANIRALAIGSTQGLITNFFGTLINPQTASASGLTITNGYGAYIDMLAIDPTKVTFTNGPVGLRIRPTNIDPTTFLGAKIEYGIYIDDSISGIGPSNYFGNGTSTFASIAYTTSTATGNFTIQKADPSIIFDSVLAGDTDFWMGVQDDAGGDDDDTFQIGDGSTPGTNPFLTIDTNGNMALGTTTFAASAVTVFSIKNGTAPSGNVTDTFQFYSSDAAAGNAAPTFRTENGDVVKLYKVATYTPTNVTTDRSYDANATTLDEVADVLGTLIADLQTLGILG